MRLLYWLITAPLLVFAVSFAISNRSDVSLSLLPLPFEITLPVAVIGLVSMLAGAIIGMLFSWANGGKMRSRARTAEKMAESKAFEIERLNAQLLRMKADIAQTHMTPDKNTQDAPLKALSDN